KSERAKVDDFYAARDNTMPSLPWPSIAPPFTDPAGEERLGAYVLLFHVSQSGFGLDDSSLSRAKAGCLGSQLLDCVFKLRARCLQRGLKQGRINLENQIACIDALIVTNPDFDYVPRHIRSDPNHRGF
ncbi:hypothetical protein ACSSVY_002276, partial [Roseovarius sp. MBR-51]